MQKGPYHLYMLWIFKMSVTERGDNVRSLKLCCNCLRLGHTKNKCSFGSCKKCFSKHNTLLHWDTITNDLTSDPSDANNKSDNPPTQERAQYFETAQTKLLPTITFTVKYNNGSFHSCRALLDSGAQSNLITQQFCKIPNIPLQSTKLSIIGINQSIAQANPSSLITMIFRQQYVVT